MDLPPDVDEAEHWRRIAEDRRRAHEALARRPLVRAAVALERRAAPAVARGRGLGHRARQASARAALAARALPGARRAAAELAEVEAQVAALGQAPAPERTFAIVELAAGATSVELGARLRQLDVEVAVVVPTGVRLLPGSAERLVAAVRSPVAVAGPTVVHEARARRDATPADGRTLAAGLELSLVDGVPTMAAREAGRPVATRGEAVEVGGVLAAGATIDLARADAVGGLAPVGDLDAALVELADRLVADGATIVHVPGTVAIDGRPVGSADALERPIDPGSASWERVVDRRGSSLRRRADAASAGLEVAITIAAPSAKVAERWGDWHLASALGAELGRLGHRATVRSVDRADDLVARSADVHLVVRGLRAVRRSPGQRHVLWIISHPLDVADDELHEADLVLVASRPHARELARRTATPVEVLLQATDHRRFHPMAPVEAHRHDLTIVAKSRERMRPMVAATLAAGLAPAIYGGGWEGLVDPALVVADHVANDELPAVYASAGVVLNDHWDDMRRLGYVSNRIFDVLACATPVISDHLDEVVDLLGGTVPTWEAPEELVALVQADLAAPAAARERAALGRERVLGAHTFEHRAAELLAALERHGLMAGSR